MPSVSREGTSRTSDLTILPRQRWPVPLPPGPSQAAERAVRRRVGPTARAVARETVEEPEDEEQAGDDLLPEVPETSSGTSSETGVEVEAVDTTAAASTLINIVEAAFANLADYNVVISEAMPGTEKYEDFRAFFSDRLEEPAVKEWKKRKASYVKKRQKEKNGKLLDYSKCSDELKRKLDATRAKVGQVEGVWSFGGHRLQAAEGAIG